MKKHLVNICLAFEILEGPVWCDVMGVSLSWMVVGKKHLTHLPFISHFGNGASLLPPLLLFVSPTPTLFTGQKFWQNDFLQTHLYNTIIIWTRILHLCSANFDATQVIVSAQFKCIPHQSCSTQVSFLGSKCFCSVGIF